MELLREFRPALVFLGKFLALYFVGNIVYGVYVEWYNEEPDGITRMVTAHTSRVLNKSGYETTFANVAGSAKVALMDSGDVVLYVFEGCNGINVMIVFIAFLFAFGGPLKSLAGFLCLGLVAIHLFNVIRVGLLFHLAATDSAQFYYYHKYLFTAALYFIVFLLWAVWVIRFNEGHRIKISQ